MIIVDDIALEATRYSKVLDNGYASSRHFGVNWACGSQTFRSLSKACRVNADVLCIHRLPTVEYQAVEDEIVGTWVNRAQFQELANHVWSRHEYGFLTI